MQRTQETETEDRYVDGNRAPQTGGNGGREWSQAGRHISVEFSLWVINLVIHSHATLSLLGLSAIPSLVTLARTADLNYGSSQVCGSLPGYPPPLSVTDLGTSRPVLHLTAQIHPARGKMNRGGSVLALTPLFEPWLHLPMGTEVRASKAWMG